jgi:hypothetical protein
MSAAWIDPRAPQRPPLRSPAYRRRWALRRLAALSRDVLELAAVSAFVGGLLAMLDALLSH